MSVNLSEFILAAVLR